MYMKSSNHNFSNKYQKAIDFLELGCGCGCSAKLSKEEFAELQKAFQALNKIE